MHDTYRVSKYLESLGFLFMLSRDGYHSKASHFQLFVPIKLWGGHYIHYCKLVIDPLDTFGVVTNEPERSRRRI